MFGLILIFITIGELINLGYSTAAIIVGIVSTLVVILPVEGFEKAECIKEVELIPMKRGKREEGNYYVEIVDIRKKKKAIYAYDIRDEYDLNATAYEEASVQGDIKIYESKDCEEPVLKVFKIKPKRLFFTIAPFSTKKQYVINVPEGTVYDFKKVCSTSRVIRASEIIP